MNTPTTPPTPTPAPYDPTKAVVMKNVETRAEARTAQVVEAQASAAQSAAALHGVMSMGTEEFKKAMGRYPTYSEMREMFG